MLRGPEELISLDFFILDERYATDFHVYELVNFTYLRIRIICEIYLTKCNGTVKFNYLRNFDLSRWPLTVVYPVFFIVLSILECVGKTVCIIGLIMFRGSKFFSFS